MLLERDRSARTIAISQEAYRHPVPLHLRSCQGEEGPAKLRANPRYAGRSPHKIHLESPKVSLYVSVN